MRTPRPMEFKILATFLALLLQNIRTAASIGYSYSRFIGPVRGPERQIIVYDRHDGSGRLDYVAEPEYQFAYGVEDAKTRVLQNRRETRNGDAVKGVYSVVDPDGSLRVVKYTADNANGFQAEVITNGVSTIHGHDNPQQLLPVTSGGNQVNGKDNDNLHHHQQVQHPEVNDAHEETDGREGADGNENDEASDSSSASRDTSDYEEKDGDGGGSEEQDDSSEEVEDY